MENLQKEESEIRFINQHKNISRRKSIYKLTIQVYNSSPFLLITIYPLIHHPKILKESKKKKKKHQKYATIAILGLLLCKQKNNRSFKNPQNEQINQDTVQ